MIDEQVIEVVAKAIRDSQVGDRPAWTWDEMPGSHRDGYLREARTALEAAGFDKLLEALDRARQAFVSLQSGAASVSETSSVVFKRDLEAIDAALASPSPTNV